MFYELDRYSGCRQAADVVAEICLGMGIKETLVRVAGVRLYPIEGAVLPAFREALMKDHSVRDQHMLDRIRHAAAHYKEALVICDQPGSIVLAFTEGEGKFAEVLADARRLSESFGRLVERNPGWEEPLHPGN